MIPNIKRDDDFIEPDYTNWKNPTDTHTHTKKRLQATSSKPVIHRSAVNRFAELPSSADNMLGQ